MLFWLLTGQAPRGTDQPLDEVLQQVRQGQFDRHLLDSKNVPRRLRAICVKAMAADPNDRYPSAEELARQLERYAAQPVRWAVAGLLLAVILTVGLVVWARSSTGRPAPPHPNAQLTIQVSRFDRRLRLRDAIPLVNGDALRVRCTVPARLAATMFWIDSQGTVQQVDQWPARDQPFQLVFPPMESSQLARLVGPPGAEMVLVCAGAGSNPTRDEVVTLLQSAPLPDIPPSSYLLLAHDRLETYVGPDRSRSLDLERFTQDPLSRAEAELERVRRRLAQRYDFVAAVVFPHAL